MEKTKILLIILVILVICCVVVAGLILFNQSNNDDENTTVTSTPQATEINSDTVSSSSTSDEIDYQAYRYSHSFEDTDSDGDGFVTLNDMNIANTPFDIRDQMYGDSDDDNDGRLNHDEYYKFMYKINYDRASYRL